MGEGADAPFIVLEGGEGVGKSTQARRLVKALEASGVEALLTREPGGSRGAEAIRDLILTGDTDRWSARTEALLFAAARNEHLERTVRPARRTGRWTVCDRFILSTRAYQGVDPQMRAVILDLERLVLKTGEPDLSLLLDADEAAAQTRLDKRGRPTDRMEAKGPDYHREVRRRFLLEAERDPARVVLIDASRPEEAVFADLWAALRRRWPLLPDVAPVDGRRS